MSGAAGTDALRAPAYGARTLGEVVPAVAHALGVGERLDIARPGDLELPEAPAYVVLLVDGLGARQLAANAAYAPYLAGLASAGRSASAGVPSTTATSLTSLGTGLPPGAHGMVGFTARVPGTDRLLWPLAWDERVDPLQWQPHATLFERLAMGGVAVSTVGRPAYARSGLTRAAHRGARYVGADDHDEVLEAVAQTTRARPSLTYVYDPALDSTGHRHGVDSWQWREELSRVDEDAQRLREALDPRVRVVLVADHGMVDTDAASLIDVDEHPELTDGVWLFGGEARLRHLYCTTRAMDDVLATWRERLHGRAVVLPREEAIAAGWFGPVATSVLPRIGDVVVAGLGGTSIVSRSRFAPEADLVGLHGSLTADEMEIPVVVL